MCNPTNRLQVRNPTDRLHCAYWNYAHYKGKYGETPEGFLAYVKEQMGALSKCEARGNFSHRECALYFEALGNDEEVLFFHADQVREYCMRDRDIGFRGDLALMPRGR